MNSYDRPIFFHIPGAFERAKMCMTLVNLYRTQEHMFKDNAYIGSVYGSPGGIWNGGRQLAGHELTKPDLLYIKDFYNKHEITVSFTFTNSLIKDTAVYDTYCNQLLEIYNTGHNAIICNSPELEKYIREKYGNRYGYISSTTKRLTEPEEQSAEFDKDYALVVLDYNHNQDFDYLNSIENKENCEILVNAVCMPNCPRRIQHYLEISQGQLENGMQTITCEHANKPYYKVKQQEHYISPQCINDTYIPMGFNHFKLEGRTAHALDLIEILIDYLIKEEYALEVRHILQRKGLEEAH